MLEVDLIRTRTTLVDGGTLDDRDASSFVGFLRLKLAVLEHDLLRTRFP
jgi:hypothetical protein